MTRKTLTIIVSLAIAIIVGCGLISAYAIYWALNNPRINETLRTLGAAMQEMAELQPLILEEYPAEGLEVQIQNGNTLVIRLINSEANDFSQREQQERAREIALFARNHFGAMEGISAIQVTFVRHREVLGLFTTQEWSYTFEVSELQD